MSTLTPFRPTIHIPKIIIVIRLRGGMVTGVEEVRARKEAAKGGEGVRRSLRGLHGGGCPPHYQIRRYLHVS